MKKEVELCDICEEGFKRGVCEVCGKDICEECFYSEEINILNQEIKIDLCCDCAENIENLKIDEESMNSLTLKFKEQLKKLAILNSMEGKEKKKKKKLHSLGSFRDYYNRKHKMMQDMLEYYDKREKNKIK